MNRPISPRERWSRWVQTLRRYQLDGFAAWMLEALRPLALLSAQALYFGRPLIGEGADALARTLESDDELHAFLALLEGDAPA